jgi:hypothetical protein
LSVKTRLWWDGWIGGTRGASAPFFFYKYLYLWSANLQEEGESPSFIL